MGFLNIFGGSRESSFAELSKEEVAEKMMASGKEESKKVLNEYYGCVHQAHRKSSLSNDQLLSTDLRVNNDVARKLRRKANDLGKSLMGIMFETAQYIEKKNFSSVEEAIKDMDLSRFDRSRFSTVIGAQKDLHVSYQTIRVAVQIFQNINGELLNEIEVSKQKDQRYRETDLLLKNTILVYELSNFIVMVLKKFNLEGVDVLKNTHDEILAEVEKNIEEDEELERRCLNNKKVDEAIRKQTLNAIKMREEMREIVTGQWDEFMAQITKVKNNVSTIKNQISNLEMIRDNAKNQLNFLQIVAITQMIKDNLEALQGLVQIEDIPLAPVTPDDLCRLLGIDVPRLYKKADI